jgi:hypothetical protein
MDDKVSEMLRRYEERTAAAASKAQAAPSKESSTYSFKESNIGPGDSSESDSKDSSLLEDALLFEGCPVLFGKSEGVDYLACLTEESGYYKYPMLYIEWVESSAVPSEGPSLQVAITTIHKAGFLFEEVFIDFDFLYMLRRSSQDDLKLYESYVNSLVEVRTRKSGLVTPSSSDMATIHSGK